MVQPNSKPASVIPIMDRRSALSALGGALLSTLAWDSSGVAVNLARGAQVGRRSGRPSADSAPANTVSPANTVTVRYKIEDQQHQVTGELLAEHSQFGHLVLDAHGALTAISPNDFGELTNNSTGLVPTAAEELGKMQLEFMPTNTKTLLTDHFVVCYNTTDSYARWNADLYENLYRGFYRFWKTKGVELTPPRFPLVALVFETKDAYVQFASQEFSSAEATYGYYHQETNRLASYDLTGIEGMLPAGSRVNRALLVQEILARPEAERTVATIVHEACHQLAFNSGLQTRLGANPLWLSEGLAMYFESPDLGTKTGWRKAGATNYHNLYNLREYFPNRSSDSLMLLLSDDDRLKAAATRAYGYAEAWGLTHFLLQTKSREFVVYLREIKEIPIGSQLTGKERVDLFCKCFGQDLAKLDRDFMRHIQRLR